MSNAALISETVTGLRNENGSDSIFLFDAGDLYSGTLYATLFDGEAETWFANHIDYDVMALGNHEFDNGSDWLATFVNRLEAPVVSSNLSFTEDSPLATSFQPYVILERGGIRYGVFGLLSTGTVESSSPGSDVIFHDEIEAAVTTVASLKKEGITRIIALSHMGWGYDMKLAARVPGIDIIIGGHSHTVPEEYPTVITATAGNRTLIVQAGSQGNYLGKLDVTFDKKGEVSSWDGRLIPIDDTIPVDAAMNAQLQTWNQRIESLKQTKIGTTIVDLVGKRSLVRSQETNLGNVVADSMLGAAAYADADIALVNGGGIRTSIPAGDISLGNVMEVLPFQNLLVAIDITGGQLITALENGVSSVEEEAGRFPQIAGFRFNWNPLAAQGSRVTSIDIRQPDGSYQPIILDAIYRLVTSEFIAGGGDGYDVFTWALSTDILGIADYEAFIDYVENSSPLNAAVEGRIIRSTP